MFESGLRSTGWGFFPLPGEKRRLKRAQEKVDQLLWSERMSPLYQEICNALVGARAVIDLRNAGFDYILEKTFDNQVVATIRNSDNGKALWGLIVTDTKSGPQVHYFAYLYGDDSPGTLRTQRDHGEEVVRVKVLDFLRNVM